MHLRRTMLAPWLQTQPEYKFSSVQSQRWRLDAPSCTCSEEFSHESQRDQTSFIARMCGTGALPLPEVYLAALPGRSDRFRRDQTSFVAHMCGTGALPFPEVYLTALPRRSDRLRRDQTSFIARMCVTGALPITGSVLDRPAQKV